jgi:PAS domain S-box-containing protein
VPNVELKLRARRLSMPEIITRTSSVLCVGAGALVLLGWWFDNASLKSMSPDWGAMKPNAALGFILAGASLWLLGTTPTSRQRRLLGNGCAAIVSLMGALTLAEYAFTLDFGIDQLLFKETLSPGEFAPGRMSPVTAVCFFLLGLALPGLDWQTRQGHYPTQALPLIAALAGLSAVTGYLYGARPFYFAASFVSPMAFHTAVLFIALGVGVLCARPERGALGFILGAGAGGFTARRLLPLALGIPVLLGWLQVQGLRAGFYDIAMGSALFATSLAVVFAMFVWRTAISLNRSETARATASKQAQEELLKAGALQNAIFNSANFSSIATDAHGVIQIFNVGAERMLGYTAADVVNRITPADISDPQEVIARAQALSGELATTITPGFEALVFKASRGIEDIYELTYIRKDGSRFPAVVSVTALRDAQDNIIGYLLIGTDNTVRKQAEAAQALLDQRLRDQQFYTRSLIESNVDALMTTDPQGIISDVNQQMIALTGRTREELMGAPCRNFFTDPDRASAGIARVLTENKVSNYELTVLAKNGEETQVSYNAATFYDRDRRLQGVFAAARDVTERKKTETRLLESEARMGAILAAAADAIITIDASGTIESLNSAAEKLFGYPAPEMVGQNLKMLMPEPYRSEHDGYLHNYASTGVKKIIGTRREVTGLRKSGETFPLELAVSQVQTGGRRLFTGIVRDITERKRFEHTLQEKNIELEHANRMKSEFLATMSHELRTPLNAIIGFSEALKDGLMGQMSELQHEYVGDIFTSGRHLLSLINDILDLSKVEAGMMTLELDAVNVNSLLQDSLSIVREKAAAQCIELALEIREDLGIPQLDMRKTKQIVYNLLSNAVKFTPKGGRVTLHARRVARASVGALPGAWPVHGFPLADSAYAEFIEIDVSDSGIGISKDDMAKLFLPFSQIDSSLARKFEGTGLGLAMVKQLAELHGGSVAVASAEGEGARFAVWLPLRTSAQAAPIEPSGAGVTATPAVAPKQHIVLVIEDDVRAAELIRVLLENEGFTVVVAASAEAALLLAPQQALSLITLDLQLPGIDGWDFLLRIRENSALAKVPVVIISGATDNNMALTGGAAAVLQKPISRSELKATLTKLGLHPIHEHSRTVLVVDDDPKAVELIASFLPAPDYAVVRAYGGSEAITLAQRLLPDLMLLDLLMPEVSGFEVVEALQHNADTARIPILVVTAKQVTAQDRAVLNSEPDKLINIVEKAEFNRARFIAEVKRALQSH